MTPEDPPGFLVRSEIEQAAHRHGWLLEQGTQGAWICRASRHLPGNVWVGGVEGGRGPFFLALDHPGVVEEIELDRIDLPGPGLARFLLADADALHGALARAWDLSKALPDHPLRRFEQETTGLPRATEAERLVVQRVGQEIFRESLMAYCGARCPLTGITDTALLRSSHIKPWRDCATDAERLDPFNGLLLSALWDAAFDAGLLTFEDTGEAVLSTSLSQSAANSLGAPAPVRLTDRHRAYLSWHRQRVFKVAE